MTEPIPHRPLPRGVQVLVRKGYTPGEGWRPLEDDTRAQVLTAVLHPHRRGVVIGYHLRLLEPKRDDKGDEYREVWENVPRTAFSTRGY